MKRSTRRSNHRRAVFRKRKVVYTYSKVQPRRLVEKHHFMTPDTLVEDHISLTNTETPSINTVVNVQGHEDSIEVLRKTPRGHESSIHQPQQASFTFLDGCFLRGSSKGQPECSTPIQSDFFLHRDFTRRKPLEEHFGKVVSGFSFSPI